MGGLVDGAAVRVGGIPRGAVTRIELPREPGGEMAVFLKLERSTRDVIRQDSVASIQTEGLLGEKYIEITFGSPDSPSVEERCPSGRRDDDGHGRRHEEDE